MEDTIRSGFVAIVGRPNVGKSTFLNTVLGTKISITASKPQTTRDRIIGIWNSEDFQIVFVDIPGIHTSDKALNKYMMEKALSAISDADMSLVMVDPKDTIETLSEVFDHLKETGKEAILVLNKADLMSPEDAGAKLDELKYANNFTCALAVSSLTGKGIDKVLDCIKEVLPEGPRFFPEDMITDVSVRFLCQELIREKVFTLTKKEIPYATAVEIEEFREGEPTYIRAVVHVERPSQKAIVIGAGGKMLKEIGKEARLDIQRLLGTRVFLELFVKVTKDWSKRPRSLKELGYK